MRALRSQTPRSDWLRALFVAIMLALVAYETKTIVPEMGTIASNIHGSLSSLATSDPRRVAYDHLHRESTIAYGLVVILGFVTIAVNTLRTGTITRRSSIR